MTKPKEHEKVGSVRIPVINQAYGMNDDEFDRVEQSTYMFDYISTSIQQLSRGIINFYQDDDAGFLRIVNDLPQTSRGIDRQQILHYLDWTGNSAWKKVTRGFAGDVWVYNNDLSGAIKRTQKIPVNIYCFRYQSLDPSEWLDAFMRRIYTHMDLWQRAKYPLLEHEVYRWLGKIPDDYWLYLTPKL